jgi:hypothetical protein
LAELSPAMRAAWGDPKMQHEMVHDALATARQRII